MKKIITKNLILIFLDLIKYNILFLKSLKFFLVYSINDKNKKQLISMMQNLIHNQVNFFLLVFMFFEYIKEMEKGIDFHIIIF